MNVEIISIGDELLIGQTINTNTSWIGMELSNIGARILKTTSISDQKKEIIDSLVGIDEKTECVIITGGLGYIGTELCKIYSGVSWNNKITVIDNRFISERVNQLRNWNIEFIHGDILDKVLIDKHCKDASVIHHLAGITLSGRLHKSVALPKIASSIRWVTTFLKSWLH